MFVFRGSTRRGERERTKSSPVFPPAISSQPSCASPRPLSLCELWSTLQTFTETHDLRNREKGKEISCSSTMEVLGKSVIAEPSNVIFLSTILNTEGPIPSHKCDKRCQNEHIFGNMYRCKLTGMTHICDKNCDQRILYDNHNSLCRVSGQLFPLSPLELQAVRGIRRKHEVDSHEGCSFKRRRAAQLHPSPFERSYSAVPQIPTQAGDGMDLS